MPTLRLVPVSTTDYCSLAEKRLPRFLFDYLDGGAYDEVTLRSNVTDFQQLKMRQTVMRDVSSVDTSIDLFEQTWAMPTMLAPIGMGGMMAKRAEVQAKEAADAIGVPFCLSTVSICSIEEVAKVSSVPFYFQLYMLKDRGAVKDLLGRAKAAGVKTLVFTVDLAVVGARYRDVRNGMSGNASAYARLRGGLIDYLLHPKWLLDVGIGGKPHVFGNLSDYVPKATTPQDFKQWVDGQFDPSCTWKDIEWLRSVWDGNLIIKGVLSAHDARAAVRAGADGVIVSNHGGRQLDGVASSIETLPRVVEACAGETKILIDGGIRNGQDVVKALALGANATMMGRPWVYAVAARGKNGLGDLLTTFKSNMTVSMSLCGVTKIADVTPDILDTQKAKG